MDELALPLIEMAHAISGCRGVVLRSVFKHPAPGQDISVWEDGFRTRTELLINDVRVGANCRGQWIGKGMAESILADVAENKSSFIAVAWPALLWTDDLQDQLRTASDAENKEIRRFAVQRAIAFFRAMEIRRVCASHYFAWSPREDHPSQQLAASDDYDPPA
jgi:hypothetical protein